MQLENGAKPLFSPICVTNTSKPAVRCNPFAALKTGFWTSPEMITQGFKEIQVPCISGVECRFDFVFKVRPKLDRKAPYKFRGNLIDLHGFEVKTSKSDLVRDAKFLNYLGLTHYFSFAVTSSLVPTAIEKLKPFPQIGIVDIETMQVIRDAKQCDVAPVNRLRIMSQMLF